MSTTLKLTIGSLGLQTGPSTPLQHPTFSQCKFCYSEAIITSWITMLYWFPPEKERLG